ncbi:MAG: hypothetical protein ABSH22_01320 [Tepidisphaeraceae bacterium]
MKNRRISAAVPIRHLICWAAALGAAAAAVTQTAAAPAAPPAMSPAAAVELADRLESMAYALGNAYKPISPILRQTAALLEAAARINPTEPRYLRLLYQVRLQNDDPDGAIAALTAYLTLVPSDQFAQAKLINLYVSKMQTTDAILAYLHGVVAKTALPTAVRSAAAEECAQTLLDHSQKDEALKMLDTALAIEPYNDAALKLKYQLLPDDTLSGKCGLLLAMLRANPLDPDAAAQLGDYFADQGLAENSADAYKEAAYLDELLGRNREPNVGKGLAVEWYLSGHTVDAAGVIDAYLNSVSADADGWTIRLAIARDLGSDSGMFDNLARRAVNEVTNRLQNVRSDMGASNATTQPSEAAAEPDVTAAAGTTAAPGDVAASPIAVPDTQPVASVDPPDMSGDLGLLAKANETQLTDSYIAAAGDLAWLRLYFLHDAGPGTQRILDSLGRLVSPDDLLFTRLQGWSYFDQGKYDEARQKFAAIADRDPYAELGLILLDDKAGKKIEAQNKAQAALSRHPSGPLAAVLYSAFHVRGVKITPGPQAAAISAQMQAFPSQWLSIINQPQQFYTITADPVQMQYPYGQAILCKVTILNTGDFDLTMGEQGILRPDMVFDAAAHGLIEKQIPQAIRDTFWQRLLLPKGRSCSQVMRLDRGVVLQLLSDPQYETVPIDLLFSVTTNPVLSKDGYVIGGAGYQAAFGKTVERTATPINSKDDRDNLYNRIVGNDPADRLRAAETAILLGRGLQAGAAGANADQQTAAAKEMFDHARQAEADSDHAVRAWAQYEFVGAAIGDSADAIQQQQLAAIQKLTTSDDWYARLLGVFAATQAMKDNGAIVAGAMADDPDPLVKDYASAVTQFNTEDAAATAAAATQPSAPQPIAPALQLAPQ